MKIEMKTPMFWGPLSFSGVVTKEDKEEPAIISIDPGSGAAFSVLYLNSNEVENYFVSNPEKGVVASDIKATIIKDGEKIGFPATITFPPYMNIKIRDQASDKPKVIIPEK